MSDGGATWRIFAMVWDGPFVRRFAELAVPFQAMAGNIPALAADARVVYHAYTDAASREALDAALRPLARWCDVDVRCFDRDWARGFGPAHVRHALQRGCLRDLVARVNDDDAIVLLDSNLAVADGSLAALAERRRQGFRAATVSVVRVLPVPFASALDPLLRSGHGIGPRALLKIGLAALHPMTEAFFVDADPFTPYPSQLSWRVGGEGFVNRNITPHPFMVPASPALQRHLSSADYELVLRSADDADIHVCRDSDEMLVMKFSGEGHGAGRHRGHPPDPSHLGRFLLVGTNRRHRVFADAAIVFHSGEIDARYEATVDRSQSLIDDAYRWVVEVAAQPALLDARLMMYLKSHLGPIEEFMSPQLAHMTLGRFA